MKKEYTIYQALSDYTGARPQAIENWCNKHGVDPYNSSGVITSNINEFIACIVSDELTEELRAKVTLTK
jgi:hypothetical protein